MFFRRGTELHAVRPGMGPLEAVHRAPARSRQRRARLYVAHDVLRFLFNVAGADAVASADFWST